ncbi:ribosomal-processing cysteine protease Prp [Leptospira idonii]|uniref:Ribosomal processing cysteine protease Prp n=1 Tax=Leptospira idonii TaxID=1193500 RepID=A0A4R9M221_9LEPT|nr:ribosomal-processing cysteine protease Prp [Leptospira idonii]TGN20790.1 ribosomal-processing cysteine protease Prp [Leptospira idonii]
MIEIAVLKPISYQKNKPNYIGLSLKGHAPSEHGEKGKNILCSAISALSQTLLMYLDNKNCLSSFQKGEGALELTIKPTSSPSIVDESFLFAFFGFKALQNQYPKDIFIREIYV